MIVAKAIKPARFRIEGFDRAIRAAVNSAADGIMKDFEATVATWNHKVKFDKIVSFTPPVEVLVGTDDEIYRYVDEGTRPHVIRPKNAPRLVFPSGYVAKTQPKVIGSRAGGGFGDLAFAMSVHHPGTEARQFDQMIKEKWEPLFRRKMHAAMRDAARASGHGI